MKVFISADMEGVTGTTLWEECDRASAYYSKFAEIMTNEVVAACKGAFAAGAKEIVVKDSHASGTNIDITKLPEGVKLIRNWSGHPFSMVEGVDATFDAALFIGYHTAAGRPGNPLSHTMSSVPHEITINGIPASEFLIYSYAAASVGVPTVFLSGDLMLCEDSLTLHPALKTVAVKDGEGGTTVNHAPVLTQKWIEAGVSEALTQDLSNALVELPKQYDVMIRFREHKVCKRKSYYPGMETIDGTTLRYVATDYFEVLRMITFVL